MERHFFPKRAPAETGIGLFHGSEQIYNSGYTEEAIDCWAHRLVAWARGGEPEGAEKVVSGDNPTHVPRDVFAYLDNDMQVRAPFDATALMDRVEVLLQSPMRLQPRCR